MKLLQLNIEGGKKLEKIANYVKSNSYDLFCIQELTGGDRFQVKNFYKKTYDLEQYPSEDCFIEFEKRFSDLKGELVKSFATDHGDSYLGNGIFYNPDRFKLLGKDEIRMGKYKQLSPDDHDFEKYVYSALALHLKSKSGMEFSVITGHFQWSPRPYDTDKTIARARVVYEYLKKINKPFILTGDFNVNPHSITCAQFEDISKNLVKALGIKNTLNPNLHRVPDLFPGGIAADQVFISPRILPVGFKVVREDLSDHYGLELEFELEPQTADAIGGLEFEE
jgi:endonuclease/exonuclease/phosphatase family metal-dependent hydrolase